MKAKIIIASPLQLINALEAKFFFNIKIIEIIFFSDGNVNNEKQIALIIKKFDVNCKVEKINIPKELSFFKRLFFLKKLRDYITENYDLIIIGHMRSIYQVALANLYTSKKVFVDDGTRTISDIKFLNNKGYNHPSYFIKSCFYRFFLVYPYAKYPSYTFFTYYANKLKVKDHINIATNDFSFIKTIRETKNNELSKKIAFVGQSLVDSDLITLNSYLELIKGVDNYYKGKYGDLIEIEYYLHRNESNHVFKKIEDCVGWKGIKNDFPLEIHFLLSSKTPLEIGLFFSSVSETLSVILENKLEIKSFLIPPHLLQYRKAEIGTLYKGYRVSNTIELIEDYF